MKSTLSEVPAGRLNDILIASMLVGFTVLFRLLTMQMVNVGPDEIDYWYHAKILFTGIPYGELDHRNIRWGILLPVFLVQRLLGTHPIVYIVPPVLLSGLQSLLLYDIGTRIFNRAAGVIAAFMLTVFPYMIRTGSQLRPGIFSLFYLLAAFWVILKIAGELPEDSGWLPGIAAAAGLFFLSYETKITNLYLLPFFALVIFVLSERRRKPLLVFLGLLAAGYLAEHLIYLIAAGETFGRLSIITGTHLESSYDEKIERYTFLGLFDRFNNTHLPLVWKLVFLLYFAAAGILALFKRERGEMTWNKLILFLVFSFTFFLTFAVKSINPVIPMEAFQNRYFTPILPWMFLVVGAGSTILPGGIGRLVFWFCAAWRRMGLVLGGVLLFFIAVFYLEAYPGSFAEYAPELKNSREHVLPLYFRYTDEVNRAWDEGLPLVSVYSVDEVSGKAIDTVNRLFLRWKYHEEAREKPRLERDGFSYQFIARKGIDYNQAYLDSIEGAPVLAVDRFPFRVWVSSLDQERSR